MPSTAASVVSMAFSVSSAEIKPAEAAAESSSISPEPLGVDIGVLGGIKGLALDRMEIHRHLLHLKEGGGRGKIAAGFLGVHAARKQRDDGALAGLGGAGQGGRSVLIDAIVI